jgi:DNA invertase Pin-like site-specific DNA recombinase
MSIMKGMKLAGYILVSRVGGREGEGYITPDLQRQAVETYAAEMGGTIARWFTDEDYSGGTLDRPGFQAALGEIRAGRLDGIVVMRIDRFARSVADGASVIRELHDSGKVFASCQERISPGTPEGRFMLTSFLANAELFLDQSKAGWRAAKSRAVARGAPIGPTPFGYLRVKSPATRANQVTPAEAARMTGDEPAVGTVIPDPETGPVVTEVFRRAAAGDTLASIAAFVNSRVPVEGRRPYAPSEVRRWLTNRFYLGQIHYGDLVATDSHPPLTDPATFRAAAPDPARSKRRPESLPLVGLLRCENCKNPMVGNRFGGPKHDRPIYRCGSRCGEGAVISASIVEPFIFDDVREAIADRRLIGAGVDVSDLDRAVIAAEEELDAFLGDLTIRSSLGPDRWQKGVLLRSGALDEARRVRDEAVQGQALYSVDLSDPSDHDLLTFAFAVIAAVYVGRGRGTDRLRVVYVDDHEPDA